MSNNIAILNDPVLQQIVNGYQPLKKQFIHSELIPTITVGARKGDIKRAGTDHLRVESNLRIDRSGVKEINVSMTKAAGWECEEEGLAIVILKSDGESFSNQSRDAGMAQARQMYTKMILTSKAIAREIEVANSLRDRTVITNNMLLSGTSQWNDYENSNPIADMKIARDSIYNSSGLEANVVFMSRDVFQTLRFHPMLFSLFATTSTKERMKGLTNEQLAMVLEVDKVLVGSARYEGAKEGQANAMSTIWGKDFGMLYVNHNPTPLLFEESFGYNFQMDGLNVEALDNHLQVPDSQIVRILEDRDFLILNPGSAYLIKDAVA